MPNFSLILFALLISLGLSSVLSLKPSQHPDLDFHGEGCEKDANFVSKFKPQIASLAGDVKNILAHVLHHNHTGATYDELAHFVDKFGSRLTGTANLERSIDFLLNKLKAEGHENVHGEKVNIPVWSRGIEWAIMTRPYPKKLNILGLGLAEGTDGKTLEAPIIVVRNFAELERRSAEVRGKIVVYNYVYESYRQATQYRSQGASQASKHGALAALIRSVTPFSINSPHTGAQTYKANMTKIPAIAITVEDAQLFQRLTEKNEQVSVRLYSENHLQRRNGTSRNVISEIVGSVNPEQVVIVSGHLDSWDVGQGAMDDGAGAFISWRALSILKKLNLKPKRTIRSILWTAEEVGLVGSEEYVRRHRNELRDISLVLESDMGTFTPNGLTYSGESLTARCVLFEILKMMKPINATRLILKTEGSDSSQFHEKGVPISCLDTQNERYLWYHHTDADTMAVESPEDIDKAQALWASVAYILASIDSILPRP